MTTRTKIEPGWYVSQHFIHEGGEPIAGPFADKEDAFKARVGIESVHPTGMTYCISEVTKPPVDLPTEPTLGILTFADGTKRSGMVQKLRGDIWLDGGWSNFWPDVTAFTPATAVPTEALDILREEPPRVVPRHWFRNRTARFLAAIDAAGDPR